MVMMKYHNLKFVTKFVKMFDLSSALACHVVSDNYGCEAKTVTSKIAKELDVCYTHMLRKVLNVSWKHHMTNKEIYRELPRLTYKIQERRKRFADIQ